jgi:hypothetical protein
MLNKLLVYTSLTSLSIWYCVSEYKTANQCLTEYMIMIRHSNLESCPSQLALGALFHRLDQKIKLHAILYFYHETHK